MTYCDCRVSDVRAGKATNVLIDNVFPERRRSFPHPPPPPPAGFNTGYLGDKCLSNEYINFPPRKCSLTVEVKKRSCDYSNWGEGRHKIKNNLPVISRWFELNRF